MSDADDGESPADPRDKTCRKRDLLAIMKNIRTADAEIKELRQGECSEGVLQEAYNSMSSLYATVILEYYDMIKDAYKTWDVHNSLWKSCFYNRIEQYRSEMRECNSDLKKLSKDLATDRKIDKFRHRLVRIVASFTQFLAASSKFYQDLMLNLETKLNVTGIDSEFHVILRHHIYKCLLYLGDIARYAEQNSDSKVKDFSVALRYYERAAFMEPECGNPHNQMAVLAGYSSAECVAVFHYCRSILARKPFASGLENLMIFYNKVKKQHKEWLEGEGAPDTVSSSAGFGERKSREASKSNKVKVFLMRFTHLHGTLFEVANLAMQQMKEQMKGSGHIGHTESSSSEKIAGTELEDSLDVTKTLDNMHDILLELEDLLAAAVFSDALLLKMLIMCIFSVHINIPPSPGSEEEKSKMQKGNAKAFKSTKKSGGQVARGPRYMGESVALIIIYEFVKKIASRARVLALPADTGKVMGTSGSGKFFSTGGMKNSSYMNRLMPVLNVFCDWLGCNSQYLMASPASLNGHGQFNKTLFADQSLIDKEGKSRASMRSCLTHLSQVLERTPSEGATGGNGGKLWRPPIASTHAGSSVSSIEAGKPLKEHIELFGFLPLAAQYNGYFFQRTGSSSSSLYERFLSSSLLPTPVPEDSARERRIKAFRGFVKEWLIPYAQREVVDAEGRRLLQQEVNAGMSTSSAGAQKETRNMQSTRAQISVDKSRNGRNRGALDDITSHQSSEREGKSQLAPPVAKRSDDTSKTETGTPASFTYLSSGSDPCLTTSAREEDVDAMGGELETDDLKQSKSDCADETESVLGEEVVFKPAFGRRAVSSGTVLEPSTFFVPMPLGQLTNTENEVTLDSAVAPSGGTMAVASAVAHPLVEPPPGLGPVVNRSNEDTFLTSLANPTLAAAMSGETAGLEEPPNFADFSEEAPWWNPNAPEDDDVMDVDVNVDSRLFGGVDQSFMGVSLLQRIGEASSWMPGIASVDKTRDFMGAEDLNGLLLPPSIPLEHINTCDADTIIYANSIAQQMVDPFTANPFHKET